MQACLLVYFQKWEMYGKNDIDILIISNNCHQLKCLLSLGYYLMSKVIIAKIFLKK